MGDAIEVTSSAVHWLKRVQARHRRYGHDSEAYIIFISSYFERFGFLTSGSTHSSFFYI